YTESACARFMSATGTYKPSIWHDELPKCILAMSLRPGNSTQFEFVTPTLAPSVAPHMGQLSWLSSTTARHHPQVIVPPDGRDALGGATVGAGGAVTTCATGNCCVGCRTGAGGTYWCCAGAYAGGAAGGGGA